MKRANTMKKTMTILMAVLGLTISAHAGGSAQYNPYTDGWTYCDQYGQSTGSARWNPYTQGWQFYDQYGQ